MKNEIVNEQNNQLQHSPAGRWAFELPPTEPWPEPVQGRALLDELASVLGRFVVMPAGAADALALWVVHTYAFGLGQVCAYIGVESPEKRCGKTTLLEVLSLLVNRPVLASNISPPAIFRVIEETRPTLLIDEADTFLQGNDELRGILNAGYNRKAAYVVRVVQSPGARRSKLAPWDVSGPNGTGAAPPRYPTGLASFSCWCPKVVAVIGRLPDTLADRCIVIRMQRKLPNEQCERLRHLQTDALRRQCARFVRDHAQRIAQARPAMPPDLNDRAADIWEPLLALADLASGPWPEKARQAAIRLTDDAQENSPIGALLFDILSVFKLVGAERIFSRSLVEALRRLPERPWLENVRDREINELWLARQLRPYGVLARNLRLGQAQAKGYALEDMRDAFARYIPRGELDGLKSSANAAGTP